MLSYPDFAEKQLVVISSDDFKDISLRNDNILIKKDGVIVNQISCFKIFTIFVIGDFSITSKLISKLIEYQISIYCVSIFMKPKFVIWWSLEWNYVLRDKQYKNDNEFVIAKQIVTNKVKNQIFLLKEIRNKSLELKNSISNMESYISKIENSDSDDSLRWYEWNVSRVFFANYFEEIGWYKRQPRVRADTINLLMDIAYSFLYGFVEANLNLYGFDIYKWVYHKLFYERKSLVCDLVEPFRCIMDKTIRKIYNLGQVDEKDFEFQKWEYNLNRENRKKYIKFFLEAIMENKEWIFLYIKNYYRAIMNDSLELPTFSL